MQLALMTFDDPKPAPLPQFPFRTARTITGGQAVQSLSVLALLHEMIAVNKARTLSGALRDAEANLDIHYWDTPTHHALAEAVAEFTRTEWKDLSDWDMLQTTERRLSGMSSRRGPSLSQADMLQIIEGAAQKCDPIKENL